MPRTWTAPYAGATAPKPGGPQGHYTTGSGPTTVSVPKRGGKRTRRRSHKRRTHRK